MELVEALDKLGAMLTGAQIERIIAFYEGDLEAKRIHQTYLWEELDYRKDQLALDKQKEERLRQKSVKE